MKFFEENQATLPLNSDTDSHLSCEFIPEASDDIQNDFSAIKRHFGEGNITM